MHTYTRFVIVGTAVCCWGMAVLSPPCQIVLKLLAFGPKLYFSDSWNVFDALIVLVSTFDMVQLAASPSTSLCLACSVAMSTQCPRSFCRAAASHGSLAVRPCSSSRGWRGRAGSRSMPQ